MSKNNDVMAVKVIVSWSLCFVEVHNFVNFWPISVSFYGRAPAAKRTQRSVQ